MHDIKSIRANPALFVEGMKKRGLGSESYLENIEALDVPNRKYKTMLASATYFRNRFNECCYKYPETIDLSSLYEDKGKYEPLFNLIWCTATFLLDNPDPKYNELPDYEFLTIEECASLENLAKFLDESLYEMLFLVAAQELLPGMQSDDHNTQAIANQELPKLLQEMKAIFVDNLKQFTKFNNLAQFLQGEQPEWFEEKNYLDCEHPEQVELKKNVEKILDNFKQLARRAAKAAEISDERYLSNISSDKFAQDDVFLSVIRRWTKHLAKMIIELLDRKYEYAQEKQKACGEELHNLLASLPNIPDDSVPEGLNERDNQLIKTSGKPRKFDFKAKDHQELGEQLGMMSFAQAAAMSGSRFVVLKDDLARLERALIDFMLGIAKEQGYQEISPPLLVQDHAMYGTGQLPKFAEDSFLTTSGHRLIPTSEVSLVNLYANAVVEKHSLPIRLTAATPCFRSEAGSAGRDTRGMIRLHQFYKTELVSLVAEEESETELERMTSIAESILENLQLPYRRVLLCAGDMGFSAAKTYDLEVWIPSQNNYREISSCSNCKSFQARRMNAKYKATVPGSTKPERFFLHTLNGSALAVGRTLVAIMENYQNPDGSIKVPEVLQEKMGKALIGFSK